MGIATSKDVRLEAFDGYPLVGTLHPAVGAVRGSVLLTGGTGIRRRFYGPFAAHLAEQGFTTLVIDYRGIGDSAPASLVGFQATKQDWGRLDMPAAFAWLGEQVPGVPRFILGHSVGGQLLGLFPNVLEADAIVTVAVSYGYWRNMPRGYGAFVGMLWYLGIPALTAAFGYLPAKRLKLGEDLPAGVAREWARWGKRSTYFAEEFADEPGFGGIRAPWLALQIRDDRIATPANTAPLLSFYRNAPIEHHVIEPHAHGLTALGHLGFFSRSSQALWPLASDWLRGRSAALQRGVDAERSAV